ncbi:MAG: energy transducer TonB [Thermodesulfobacteriota bacterium]
MMFACAQAKRRENLEGATSGGMIRISRPPVVVAATRIFLCCMCLSPAVPTADAAVRHYIELVASREESKEAGRKESYLHDIRQRIERSRQYPLPARRRGEEGRVTVAFALDHDGNLESVDLASSCRHRRLNQAALAAVRQAAPFPAPPAGIFPAPLALSVELVFSLQEPDGE